MGRKQLKAPDSIDGERRPISELPEEICRQLFLNGAVERCCKDWHYIQKMEIHLDLSLRPQVGFYKCTLGPKLITAETILSLNKKKARRNARVGCTSR